MARGRLDCLREVRRRDQPGAIRAGLRCRLGRVAHEGLRSDRGGVVPAPDRARPDRLHQLGYLDLPEAFFHDIDLAFRQRSAFFVFRTSSLRSTRRRTPACAWRSWSNWGWARTRAAPDAGARRHFEVMSISAWLGHQKLSRRHLRSTPWNCSTFGRTRRSDVATTRGRRARCPSSWASSRCSSTAGPDRLPGGRRDRDWRRPHHRRLRKICSTCWASSVRYRWRGSRPERRRSARSWRCSWPSRARRCPGGAVSAAGAVSTGLTHGVRWTTSGTWH